MSHKDGKRGSVLHDAIVDWVRFDLIRYIRTIYPDSDWSCIADDVLIMHLLGISGNIKNKSVFIPDCIWDDGKECIVIEVGYCDLRDVPPGIQMLHIGFDGQVNIVNPEDNFILDVANTVKDYIIESWDAVN